MGFFLISCKGGTAVSCDWGVCPLIEAVVRNENGGTRPPHFKRGINEVLY
jgi:hypothetical protein